jgi:hypothetical protein
VSPRIRLAEKQTAGRCHSRESPLFLCHPGFALLRSRRRVDVTRVNFHSLCHPKYTLAIDVRIIFASYYMSVVFTPGLNKYLLKPLLHNFANINHLIYHVAGKTFWKPLDLHTCTVIFRVCGCGVLQSRAVPRDVRGRH